MNTRHLKWKKYLSAALSFCLCATIEAYAQGRGGGGGGGGGGFGGGRGNAASGQQYNPNGAVGNAVIQVDPNSRSLIINADEATTEAIMRAVSNLDHPSPQVLIKVVFLEVTHNNALDIGFEGGYTKQLNGGTNNPITATLGNAFGLSGFSLPATGSNSPTLNPFGQPVSSFGQLSPYTGLPGAGLYQILGTDFQATLRAISQAGKAELLSRPSILASDSQTATITVGQSVPLITSVTYVGTSGFPVNNVTYTSVGIILRVTPFIRPDGTVELWVQPQTSAIDSTLSIPIAVGVNAPVIDIRSADTVVITPNAQTVVIGGLMQNTKASIDNKIPFLGDIPLLGSLFKRKVTSNAKTELLIFLTPHIVQAPSQLAALSTKEQNQSSLMPKSFSEQELDRFLDRVPVKQNPPGK